MKKVVIGGFLALCGTILELAVLYFVGNNLVGTWPTRLGRFLTTVAQTNMTAPFILATLLFGLGVLILLIEYFKKD